MNGLGRRSQADSIRGKKLAAWWTLRAWREGRVWKQKEKWTEVPLGCQVSAPNISLWVFLLEVYLINVLITVIWTCLENCSVLFAIIHSSLPLSNLYYQPVACWQKKKKVEQIPACKTHALSHSILPRLLLKWATRNLSPWVRSPRFT